MVEHIRSWCGGCCSWTIVVFGIVGGQSTANHGTVVEAQDQGICDRTQEVQDSIADWLETYKDCATYTDAELASLSAFSVRFTLSLSTLKSGDFAGMDNITEPES